jgi:hypothetical protein
MRAHLTVEQRQLALQLKAGGGRDGYRAWRAHQRAHQQARRPKTAKLACPELAAHVTRWLQEWWSPVQIPVLRGRAARGAGVRGRGRAAGANPLDRINCIPQPPPPPSIRPWWPARPRQPR